MLLPWRNRTDNNLDCVKWKETKAALAKRTPVERSKDGSSPSLAAPKAKLAELSGEQENFGPGWSHIVRDSRIFRAIPADPHPTSDPVTLNPTLV
jgi:hypothetical protein